MSLWYISIVFTVLLQAVKYTQTFPHYIQPTVPHDPLLSEFVWFSSSSYSTNYDQEDPSTSSTLNILPLFLPGSADTLLGLTKKKQKARKLQKMMVRLKWMMWNKIYVLSLI